MSALSLKVDIPNIFLIIITKSVIGIFFLIFFDLKLFLVVMKREFGIYET